MNGRALSFGWMCAVALAGCRDCQTDASPPPRDSTPRISSPCGPRTGEHLGIPFVKLCPEDLAPTPVEFEPFWIASQQLGCSAGEHGTLACPTVTAIQHPALGETRSAVAIRPTLAAVVEARVAQTLCYMRFGGRLPTREERARAEQAFGLVSVMISQPPGQPVRFELRRLAEWVTAAPCTTSNSSGCASDVYPRSSREPIPWNTLFACDGTPSRGGPLLALGETCPLPDFPFDAGTVALPCGIRSPALRSGVPGFTLSCRPLGPEQHPDDRVDTAAFRCVLPGTTGLPDIGEKK